MVRTLCLLRPGRRRARRPRSPRRRRSRYRIELTNGEDIAAADAPSQRGTVVVFHRASDGALDGVPAEMVARIEPAAATRRDAVAAPPGPSRAPGQALEPGEVVDLGTTDDAYVTPRATRPAPAPLRRPRRRPRCGTASTTASAIGGGPARTPVNTLLASVPSSTDLALASGSSVAGARRIERIPGRSGRAGDGHRARWDAHDLSDRDAARDRTQRHSDPRSERSVARRSGRTALRSWRPRGLPARFR